MAENRIQNRLAFKVYTIVIASVFFCAFLISIYNYYQNRRMLRESIGVGLKKVAQTASLGINARDLAEITSQDDYYYRQIQSFLIGVKYYNDIESPINILKPSTSNMSTLILTTEAIFPLGVEYRLNNTLKSVLDTGKSRFSDIYKDRNGTWLSAYAPIQDDDGGIVGVIELNQRIDYYIHKLRIRLLEIIMICLIGCIIGILLGVHLMNPILGSIDALSKAAVEIQSGNYDNEIKLKSEDEIGHLALTLENMRVSIKKYIEQLREAWVNERQAHLESVKTLSEAIAVREPYTKGHIERVSKYAELIAREMGLSEEEVETLRYGCVLHDVGKIGINIDIINKPSELSDEEYRKIKEHPHMGAKIIGGVKFLEKAKDIILHHQERYDGTGYPSKLRGDEIPLAARIVTLADAYDAMSSDRPYRDRLSEKEIEDVLKRESGKQFDPKVVRAFFKIKNKVDKVK